MFYTEFDDLLPEDLREENKDGGGFYPEHLRGEIDEMNEWGEFPFTALRIESCDADRVAGLKSTIL